MTLINCKVQLKFNWTKHCVLAAAKMCFSIDNFNADDNNIIFMLSLYQQKTIKNYQIFLAKDLND